MGGLTGGYIGYGHGWAAVWWACTALSGLVFLGVALIVPETLFDRGAASSDDGTSISSSSEDAAATSKEEEPSTKQVETAAGVQPQPEPTQQEEEHFFTYLSSNPSPALLLVPSTP